MFPGSLYFFLLNYSAPESKFALSLLQDVIKSSFQDIVTDELKKIKDSSITDCFKFQTSTAAASDELWEYNGLHNAYQGECEEILLEMQRIFYDDVGVEPTRKGETWSLLAKKNDASSF